MLLQYYIVALYKGKWKALRTPLHEKSLLVVLKSTNLGVFQAGNPLNAGCNRFIGD